MSLGWRRSRDPTPQKDSGLLATLTALFGLLAGFATLVYIGGGSIMALRLEFARLPNPTAVASRLAREVLISVGLTLIVGPALLVFIVYASWRIATAYDAKVADIPRNWPIALAGGALLALPGFLWAIFPSQFRGWGLLLFLPALILTTLVVRGALGIREALITQHWPHLRIVVALGILWAVTAIPAFVILGSVIRFNSAHICGAGGQIDRAGLLVGETDDRIYLGAPSTAESGRRTLLIMPMDQVEEVYVGGSVECDVQPGGTTPAAAA